MDQERIEEIARDGQEAVNLKQVVENGRPRCPRHGRKLVQRDIAFDECPEGDYVVSRKLSRHNE